MKDSQSLKKKQRKFVKKTTKPVASLKKSPESGRKDHGVWLRKFFMVLRWFFTLRPKQTVIKKKDYAFIKSFEKDLVLLLIPLTLFFVFFVLVSLNDYYIQIISNAQLAAFPQEATVHPYPLVRPLDAGVPLLSLSAKSAIIIDSDSQVVIFSKNPQLRFSMASTTKIMTALTALDYYRANSVLTIKSANVQGSVLGFSVGDTFYFEDLLYAMLLPSANDAALAIADNFPGGPDVFIARMNGKAVAFQLSNTHFADSTGLEDDGDYTTVVDMAHLASLAIKNKEFAKVTGTKQKLITNIDKSKQYMLSNLNKLLGVDGVIGIKTGTTEGAGEVLVTSSVKNGHTFIIVVMNSQDRFVDTQTLLNYISNNVEFVAPQVH